MCQLAISRQLAQSFKVHVAPLDEAFVVLRLGLELLHIGSKLLHALDTPLQRIRFTLQPAQEITFLHRAPECQGPEKDQDDRTQDK